VGFKPTISVSEVAKRLFIETVYSYVLDPKNAAPVTVLRQARSAGVKEKLPDAPGKGGSWIVQ
jgi:hypothetical protein